MLNSNTNSLEFVQHLQ